MPAHNRTRRIIADALVASVNDGLLPPPPDWGSRALYPGRSGADNWLAVVGDPAYVQNPPDRFGLDTHRALAVRDHGFRTLVSLGPGDGLIDARLVRSLCRGRNAESRPRIRYIPVEISRPLLETAMANLARLADVPVGVLCDFEAQLDFLAEAVARPRAGPTLFALLGGTVGNLDGREAPFFAGIRRMMRPGDAFLVELSLAGPAWVPETEPRLRPEGYPEACRRFFYNGLGRTPAADGAGKRFAGRLGFSLRHDAETGAEVIVVTDRLSGRTALNRRYRWGPILRWFEEQSFTVAFAKSSLATDQDRFGMGVVLLTPPEPASRHADARRSEAI